MIEVEPGLGGDCVREGLADAPALDFFHGPVVHGEESLVAGEQVQLMLQGFVHQRLFMGQRQVVGAPGRGRQ